MISGTRCDIEGPPEPVRLDARWQSIIDNERLLLMRPVREMAVS